MQDDDIAAGQVLAGKYRVERVLGVGGMGVVVLAHHLHLDTRVAIKFMTRAALQNPEAVARFSREARAVVKIKSEHVARVSDVGTLDTGEPYMVMEYLEGGDLSAWLKNHGRLTGEQAVDFILQACEAIAEAHALGIVHRDLKPANLFVLRRPDGALAVKVLDFGISKLTLGPELGMTKTSAVMGSPLYMSPEQMRAVKEADARTDIWALGVILYELLTGVTPFLADQLPELVLKIASEAPEPLRNRAPEVPPALEAVIMKCLEKDPGKRFPTLGDFAFALAPFAPRQSKISIERIAGVLQAAGLSPSDLRMPASSEGPPVETTTAATWGQTTPGTVASRRALFGVGGISAVIAVAGAVVYLVRSHTPVLPEEGAPSALAASAPEAPPAALPATLNAPPTSVPPPPTTPPPAASATTAPSAAAQVLGARPATVIRGSARPPPHPVASTPLPAAPPAATGTAPARNAGVFVDRK